MYRVELHNPHAMCTQTGQGRTKARAFADAFGKASLQFLAYQSGAGDPYSTLEGTWHDWFEGAARMMRRAVTSAKSF